MEVEGKFRHEVRVRGSPIDLTEPRAMGPLFRFIHDTGRFAATYGELALHDEQK
ncbi:hypothetical protein DAEQUDRAFT_723548 [Daedalea quercina L-15889]|uniref:Uncharacterized protein n=1 Tax=Daedalea quercina L-15889 TaxID=1314783 RepID=A0A165SG17_9APHY|nr:hypothetical protein DAEQUDRAFT_723548 [Daedalea quercina L-15889]